MAADTQTYTLSGASHAARWLAGEMICTKRTALHGITAAEFQSLVDQCPHDDLTDDQAQMIFDTANYDPCRGDVLSLHENQQEGQDAGVIARTEGTEPWQ